jgi:uncharacterized membrane protein YozB (DUF420 family)
MDILSKELISYLKLIHGTYNMAVILLFVYQGILGVRMRRSNQKPAHLTKRHRKVGPIAAVLGIAGFIAGTTLVYLDAGRIFKYPFHFITGAVIVSLIITTYLISGKIKGTDSYWRNRHYVLGLLIISLYFIQAFLGLGILL